MFFLEENKKKTFGQKLNPGLEQGLELLGEYDKERKAKAKADKDRATANKKYKDVYKIDLEGVEDPKERQEVLKQGLKRLAKEDERKELAELFNKERKGEADEAPEKPTSPKPKGILRPEFSDEGDAPARQPKPKGAQGKPQKQDKPPYIANEIAVTALRNKPMADVMQHSVDKWQSEKQHGETLASREEQARLEREQRQNLHNDNITAKANEANRKETMPLRKQYADRAAYARSSIENKKFGLNILNKGKVDDPLKIYLSSLLPGGVGNTLLSDDTQLYKTGLFDEFGVVRQMFPGATRVKELDLLEDKLASLDKNDSAKKAILENGIKKLEKDVILAKAARQIEKENPNMSSIEYEEAVQERAQPELDKLYQEIVDGYEEIYFNNAPEKSSYVGSDGHEYLNVKKSDLKALFKAAKENNIDLKLKK